MATPKKAEVAKKAEAIAAKTTKVAIEFIGDSASIYRGEGLPILHDKADRSVEWLASKGFTLKEIEVIVIKGNKPANWETFYPSEEVPAPEVVSA
jgi:hypothetical protein